MKVNLKLLLTVFTNSKFNFLITSKVTNMYLNLNKIYQSLKSSEGYTRYLAESRRIKKLPGSKKLPKPVIRDRKQAVY